MFKLICVFLLTGLFTKLSYSTDIANTTTFNRNLNVSDIESTALGFFIDDGRDENYALAGFTKVTWFQAQQTCASQGLTLVSFPREIDLMRLRNFIFTKAYFLLNEFVWSSGNELATKNGWTWFSNGRPFTFMNWERNEPRNYYGRDKRCLRFHGGTTLWSSYDCNARNYFICQKRC